MTAPRVAKISTLRRRMILGQRGEDESDIGDADSREKRREGDEKSRSVHEDPRKTQS
ncbi:hypothetical protein [Devosia sp.]|uniref:hypothetical protein n=1 Tax=Devosia sp. TaxID=1871048 RepID=UPI0025F5E3A7|nr:hypothetical protein [Devosia sp.]MCR6635524.1 hypothetical protein [Devosia sp.]